MVRIGAGLAVGMIGMWGIVAWACAPAGDAIEKVALKRAQAQQQVKLVKGGGPGFWAGPALPQEQGRSLCIIFHQVEDKDLTAQEAAELIKAVRGSYDLFFGGRGWCGVGRVPQTREALVEALRNAQTVASSVQSYRPYISEEEWEDAQHARKWTAWVKVLEDGDELERVEAARAFVTLREAQALPALKRAGGDESPLVRFWATRALGALNDAKTLVPVLAALDDPCAAVRMQAVKSLKGVDDPKVLKALKAAKEDDDPEVRKLAKRALREWEDKLNGEAKP